MNILFFDTETTGLHERQCWQVGFVQCCYESGEKVAVFSDCFDLRYPSGEIEPKFYNCGEYYSRTKIIHNEAFDYAKEAMGGHYDEDEFNSLISEFLWRDREEKIDEFIDAWEWADQQIAWNADFDQPVVEDLLARHGRSFSQSDVRCLMKTFKKNFPGQRFKLTAACQFFGISVDGCKTHNALYDSELVESVYDNMFGYES